MTSCASFLTKVMFATHPTKKDVRLAILMQKLMQRISSMHCGPMRCRMCTHPVTSQEHSQSCVTVSMWDDKTWNPHSDPKTCMMTYGLNGCTCIVAEMEDGTVVMSHDPSNVEAARRITRRLPVDTPIVKLTVVSKVGYRKCEVSGMWKDDVPELPALPPCVAAVEHKLYRQPCAVYVLPSRTILLNNYSFS